MDVGRVCAEHGISPQVRHSTAEPPVPGTWEGEAPAEEKYPAAIRYSLVLLWKAANCICGKRLVPFLGELVTCLERHKDLSVDPEVRALLLEISAATLDRLLRRERQMTKPRGLGTTKPGTLLKKQIPVRTFADWNERRAGFLEVDLVATVATA